MALTKGFNNLKDYSRALEIMPRQVSIRKISKNRFQCPFSFSWDVPSPNHQDMCQILGSQKNHLFKEGSFLHLWSHSQNQAIEQTQYQKLRKCKPGAKNLPLFSINNTDKLVQVALIYLSAQECGTFHLGLGKDPYPGFRHPQREHS